MLPSLKENKTFLKCDLHLIRFRLELNCYKNKQQLTDREKNLNLITV